MTDSMYPTIKAGDMIIYEKVDPHDLEVNDIITYWTLINGERMLNTHRIVNIYDGGNGKLIFETKGDNNDMADVLNVYENDIVGKMKETRPKNIFEIVGKAASSLFSNIFGK